MARKRMFSLDVVDTDWFLDMGSGARLLYYDLGMRADDDGFVQPMKVIRMTNANVDDLKLLIAKGFVHMFEDGVVVILHWRRNNKMDAGKYAPSVYHPRLRKVTGYVPHLPSGGQKKPLETGSESGSMGVRSIGKVSTVQILPIRDEQALSPLEGEIDISGIEF